MKTIKQWFISNRIGWWLIVIVTLPFVWISYIRDLHCKAFDKL